MVAATDRPFAGQTAQKQAVRQALIRRILLAGRALFLREEHSMDRCQCRPELSDRFGSHWFHMNFRGNLYGLMAPSPCFQGNSYGPMALKVRLNFSKTLKFPLRLVLVHGWLFPIPCKKATRSAHSLHRSSAGMASAWGRWQCPSRLRIARHSSQTPH